MKESDRFEMRGFGKTKTVKGEHGSNKLGKETSCVSWKTRPAATPEPMSKQVAGTAKDPKASYYAAGGVEVLDVIKAKLTPEQFKGWLLGNIVKYSARANFKGQFARDIEKIKFYSSELFEILEA